MLKHVRSIVAAIVRRFRSRAILELENLALRHQLHVLRRQRPGRPHLITIDRLLWVWFYRLWPRCLDTMVLVKPATSVVQWHRQGFRLVLGLALGIRTAISGSRSSGFDSANERREPVLWSAPDPRRTVQGNPVVLWNRKCPGQFWRPEDGITNREGRLSLAAWCRGRVEALERGWSAGLQTAAS